MPGKARSSRRVGVAREALLDDDAIGLLERVQGVVCETHRAQIVRALAATTLTAGEVAAVVGLTKWAASRHLRLLRDTGVVTGRRRGRQVFYGMANGLVPASALAILGIVVDGAGAESQASATSH